MPTPHYPWLLALLALLGGLSGFVLAPTTPRTAAYPLLPAAATSPAQVNAPPPLTARVVAVGIPGAGAISPVGTFHRGGPIHDWPQFAAFTEPGEVLDPARILIASTSNFGAPLARTDQAPGAILSVDPGGSDILQVPAAFAAAGDQASALDGRVRLFTAQSANFVNALYNPEAVTAAFPPVSDPRAISLNNAFGRPWFANAPRGMLGPGLESVLDPDGRPLAGAPSHRAGGVFEGDQTNRQPQLEPGALTVGAVGTALLGRSPDGDGRAVFAVALADGSLVQIHVEKALDGLAAAGTIAPLPAIDPRGASPAAPAVTRAGVVFNWVPNTTLFVADPVGNAVVAVDLVEDGAIFRVASTWRLVLPELDRPVDLAPAVPEVANPGFSSNTTLAGGSDYYVANRGNGTIVRLRQDGTVVAVRQIEVPGLGLVGAGRLNGLAVAPDSMRLWATLSGPLPDFPGLEGAVVELPAFGAPSPNGQSLEAPSDLAALQQHGAQLFQTPLTPEQGLGPLFNARACVACHLEPVVGGVGPDGLGVHVLVGRLEDGQFDSLLDAGGPIARAHSVAELGFPCDREPGIPVGANLTSVRNATQMFGLGLIDAIPDDVIRAQAIPRGDGVLGRPNLVRDAAGQERVGRFGWKAETTTLERNVAQALRNEHGITSPLVPLDGLPARPDGVARCPGESDDAKDGGSMVTALTAFIAALRPPPAAASEPSAAGAAIFEATGCASCHVPRLQVGDQAIPLYSDLLIHDLGTDLDDGVVQGSARGRDWRTAPLWGLGSRSRYLHDGRARNIRAAILSHGGEATRAGERFRALTPEDRAALLAFLASL